MKIKPSVTRKAPSQSIRLSTSSEGTSSSMDIKPPRKHRNVSPLRRKKEDRQVLLFMTFQRLFIQMGEVLVSLRRELGQ